MKNTDINVSIGLSLPNRAVLFGWPVDLLVETAVKGEESGAFDSVWVGDNFLSKPRLEAITLLSALATATTRVTLGTACLATFSMRAIIPFAIQWASLDLLSRGRTILTVCNGESARAGAQFAAEWEAMGVKSEDRVARLEEGIGALRLLWESEGAVDFDGKFHNFRSVELLPKPAQNRILIVLAANPAWNAKPHIMERAFRRVAEFADGWQTAICPAEMYADRWATIQGYAEEYGRSREVYHASYHLMVNINDDSEKARTEAVSFLDKYYGSGFMTDEMTEAWVAYGSPGAVLEKIRGYIEAGCNTPILRFAAPDQLGQLGRYVAEIAPELDSYRKPPYSTQVQSLSEQSHTKDEVSESLA